MASGSGAGGGGGRGKGSGKGGSAKQRRTSRGTRRDDSFVKKGGGIDYADIPF